MSKETREFFAKLENAAVPEVGAMEVMGGIGEAAMSFREGMGKLWDALTPAFELGAEEVSRAMFAGQAYVFHGDTIPHEMQQHGLPVEAPQKEAEGRSIEM